MPGATEILAAVPKQNNNILQRSNHMRMMRFAMALPTKNFHIVRRTLFTLVMLLQTGCFVHFT